MDIKDSRIQAIKESTELEQLVMLIVIVCAAAVGVMASNGQKEHLGTGIFMFFFVIVLVGGLIAYAS